MQIYSINPFNFNNPSFEGRGKPLDLKYILEKRSHLLPQRVLDSARTSLSGVSLPEIHRSIYNPLLDCKTLDEAKSLYPEFAGIAESVTFSRESVYKRQFEERTKGMNFPLKMLQELWGNLKTKDEVAQELGLPNRTSLDWALKQIGFVYFQPNYRVLLKASDEAGNREIAQKTRVYNQANPELMYARNKHAAQGCKTEEYRAAQRARMIEYDKLHPERREKISEFDKRVWELCPEIKDAMAQFAMGETAYVRGIVMKKTRGVVLTEQEKRVDKGFYKRFWAAHPELRNVLAAAKAQVRKEMGK